MMISSDYYHKIERLSGPFACETEYRFSFDFFRFVSSSAYFRALLPNQDSNPDRQNQNL